MASFQLDPGATRFRCYAALSEDSHPDLKGVVVSDTIVWEVNKESDPKNEARAEHKRALAAEELDLNSSEDRRAQIVEQGQMDQVDLLPTEFNLNGRETVEKIREEHDPNLSDPQDKLLRWHYFLGNIPFSKINLMAKR